MEEFAADDDLRQDLSRYGVVDNNIQISSTLPHDVEKL